MGKFLSIVLIFGYIIFVATVVDLKGLLREISSVETRSVVILGESFLSGRSYGINHSSVICF